MIIGMFIFVSCKPQNNLPTQRTSPTAAAYPAHLTHAQSVTTLSPQAVLLARSEGERQQAFRIGRHAWGVQFHPEFDTGVMTRYLEVQTPALRDEGQDPAALIQGVTGTDQATSLLRRFAKYVGELT